MPACSRCRLDKPTNAFHRRPDRKRGCSSECKECYKTRCSLRLATSPTRVTGTQRCTKCEADKPVTDFYRHPTCEGGRATSCRACQVTTSVEWRRNNYTRARAWIKANPEKAKASSYRSYLKRQYGLTPEKLAAMRAAQGGRCALCARLDKLHIDHDHATGIVRELLCGHCNRGLGMFRDDPELFVAAIAYLTKHRRIERTA